MTPKAPMTDREKFRRAAKRQLASRTHGDDIDWYGISDDAAQYRTMKPTPNRITHALNQRGLYGPQVDQACGVEEPAVDMWEAGALVPTFEQVEALAKLTEFPIGWFYQPPIESIDHGIVCWKTGGCEAIGRDKPAVTVGLDEATTIALGHLAEAEGVDVGKVVNHAIAMHLRERATGVVPMEAR